VEIAVSAQRAANAIDRRLGERVRSRRLALGISQERLAELLGITFQQVQKYEKGANRIAASRLYEIAAALDMSVADFFESVGGPSGSAGARHLSALLHAPSPPEAKEVVRLFASIKSHKVRRRLLELLRSLAGE
jgi:transcriptional regulator with XRE-family HTH domain